MRIGAIDLVPLSDGDLAMEQAFYVGLDFAAHPELLGDDDHVHIPVGCFLVRTGEVTVLIDAGLGVVEEEGVARVGLLPAALREVGVEPDDVDVVVCTHLHTDHIGWLAVDDAPFFPRAAVRYGREDWTHFITNAEGGERCQRIMSTLEDAGRLEPLEGDLVRIAPGITARQTPGHTPGHYGLVIASGDARAYVLGDAVEHPLQIAEPEFHAMSDVDPAMAARTREALWRELEGDDSLITGAHFPGLVFGRVLAGRGRRFVPVG